SDECTVMLVRLHVDMLCLYFYFIPASPPYINEHFPYTTLFRSLRAGRKSTIITSNLPCTRWNEIFHDQVLTAALTDRLTHKSHVLNMNGPSFRMRETEEWLKKESTNE